MKIRYLLLINVFLAGLSHPLFSQDTVFLAPQQHKLLYADTVYREAIAKKDTLLLAEAYYLYGKTYEATGDYVTSKSWFLKSLRILEPRGDSPKLSRLYTRLSNLAFRQGDYKEASRYTRTAIDVAKRVKSYQYLSRAYGNMAGIHETDWSMGGNRKGLPGRRLDSTLYYLRKVEWLGRQNKDSAIIVNIKIRLGNYLVNHYKDTTAFLSNYKVAADYFTRKKEDGEVLGIKLGLANYYLYINDPKKALKTLLEADEIYRKNPFRDIGRQVQFEESYSWYYQLTGDWKRAFEHKEKMHKAQISSYVSDREGAMNRMGKEYELEKKDMLLKAKDTEINLRTKAFKAQQRFTIVSILLLLVTATMSLIFYKLFKKNQRVSRQNEILVREQNHRVKNNLQAISSLLSLQSDALTDPGAIMAIEESRLRVETMAILHRKLYDGKRLAMVYIPDFIEELTESVLNTYGYENVELNIQSDPIYLDADKAVHVGLIMNELVTNACKYAFPGNDLPSLYIECNKHVVRKQGHIKLRFADNGQEQNEILTENFDRQGHSQVKNRPGFGLKLIKMETEQLYASYKFFYINGTIFEMEFRDDKNEVVVIGEKI